MKMMERKAYTAFGETGFGETGRPPRPLPWLRVPTGDVVGASRPILYSILAANYYRNCVVRSTTALHRHRASHRDIVENAR